MLSSQSATAPGTKSGWLVKQGHVFRTWKKRWFVLEDQLLKYYKVAEPKDDAGSSDAAPVLQELKGCISIQHCELAVAAADQADGRQFCFRLTPISRKIYLIMAPDEESRDAWMSAIAANSKPAAAGAATAGTAAAGGPSAAPELPDVDPSQVKNAVDAGSTVTLAAFELKKVIGRGTYGKVMQVQQKSTGEIFAMKVIKKENIFARNDPKDLQHTIAERNVLALVNNKEHPFILGLKFAFHTPAKLYYVLNFCNGGDLYYLISRCKKFKEAQARFYTGQVFLALQHLHSLGVIYRDLKPENVLLDADGHVKLTDFGLSKESDTADTFCGTPVYLAPEIWLRKTYGYEVDWWSLGCVLYEMVCGLPPFWGDTIKDVYKKVIHSTPKYNPGAMSAECQALIEGLLQREPKERLGGKPDSADIQTHEFFAAIKWDDLLNKVTKPPFKSKSQSADDTQNFHKAFTNQKPIDSVSNPSILNELQQQEFEGFTYVPTSDLGAAAAADADADGEPPAPERRKSQFTQPEGQ